VVPVPLNAERVIGLNRVNEHLTLRESEPDLPMATEYVRSASELMPPVHADEIDVPSFCSFTLALDFVSPGVVNHEGCAAIENRLISGAVSRELD
jgi:hypothetical protein